MKMKYACTGLLLLGLGLSGPCMAQDTSAREEPQPHVKRHTLMARFEPGMVPPAEERIALKEERRTTVAYRSGIIDTLDVSKRKKRKLLEELHQTPFTDVWESVIADMQFEEDSEKPPQ